MIAALTNDLLTLCEALKKAAEENMPPKIRHLSAALTLFLVFSAFFALEAETRSSGESLPTLQTIKLLQYTKATNNKGNGALSYSELWELINACKAYSRGIEILPRFHEPIQTRGETGISIFKKASPSVVMVVTANFKDDKVTDSGLGTGVIIDPSGYVLTNWHVIHGFETGIIFLKPTSGTEPDKNSAYGVELISQSEQADLALLKIVRPPAGLAAVKLGDLSSIQVAEDIHIIGHPHGQLWSYSTGVVSQVRDNYDWKYADGSKHLARVLQMQTAINPGNSGGPVLDNSATMLGLVAMSEEGQNLNYAVAIDVIKDFVSKAVANRSRGANSPSPSEKGEQFIGNTEETLSVVKVVYSNLVSYTVRDSKGVPIEQIAEGTDGTLLMGSKVNGFGGFSEWIFKSSSGKTVSIRSSGITPDLVSLGVANQ
jgi:S1-C subfamily serine protease